MPIKKLLLPVIGFALVAAVAVVAVVAASSGDGSDGDNDRESVSAEDQGKVAGDGAGLAMCAEDVPDCNDMIVNPDGGDVKTDDAVSEQPPITSIDDIDPDECNLVHNIDACEKQAMAAAVADLVRNTGVGTGAISVVSAEMTEWPDACLGVAQPKVACAEVITTGFRITLTAGEIQYEYRTDATGATVFGGK
jgi:hypothetical protein